MPTVCAEAIREAGGLPPACLATAFGQRAPVQPLRERRLNGYDLAALLIGAKTLPTTRGIARSVTVRDLKGG
jgi:hypothetical protein